MTEDGEVLAARLEEELRTAERKAWDSLAHGKYQMFGYWAAIHVHLRAITGKSHEPSPFRELVAAARSKHTLKDWEE